MENDFMNLHKKYEALELKFGELEKKYQALENSITYVIDSIINKMETENKKLYDELSATILIKFSPNGVKAA